MIQLVLFQVYLQIINFVYLNDFAGIYDFLVEIYFFFILSFILVFHCLIFDQNLFAVRKKMLLKALLIVFRCLKFFFFWICSI